MKRFLRDNGLTLFFLLIMLLALAGQAVSGLLDYNDRAASQGGHPVTLWRYVTGSQFAVDVAENWQSEYLQFFLFIIVTVWLVQRGSPESKALDKQGTESDADQLIGIHAREDSPGPAKKEGFPLWLYGRSLGLTMGVIFLLSWFAQSVAGRAAFNAERLADHRDTLTWTGYLASADFWNRTLQNWQSEFLAVASMAVLSIYLRQRGSPESKPVGIPHHTTNVEG
ncbi:DUF6766 family protein [Actinocorallia libanotica]|uniref:Transmembrane protein n=1 Tax=Actinocorallia libanotica TaxID=46162 RepID=A0ABN1Q764_9ACTN